jgi:DSF synthase
LKGGPPGLHPSKAEACPEYEKAHGNAGIAHGISVWGTPIVSSSEPQSFLEQLRFLSRTYEELQAVLDPNTNCVWCYLRPKGQPSFTPLLVRELAVLHRAIQALGASQEAHETALIRYYVLASQIHGIFNMGGDLSFLADKICRQDREAIRCYAHSCVDVVFRIAMGFDCGIVTVALVQGDALGGGLEAALSCNFIVAERGVKMGLPEVIFNLFPGMGAYSMLSRRIGMAMAERIIFSGRLYSAEEMYELGVIDLVVDAGCGDKAVRDYIAEPRSHSARQAIFRARQRMNPVTLAELRDITDMWVNTAMALSEADLRRMNHLQAAQSRRLRREAIARELDGLPTLARVNGAALT